MRTTITFILGSTLLVSCLDRPVKTCSAVKSESNRVSCKVDYSSLHTDNLAGIKITDIGISAKEKIRHLNELNQMPKEFLNIMRSRITVNLTYGGITNLPTYANLKGVTPRGWPAGSTWDDVPGAGGVSELALGDSGLGNNAWSLAIHEATHSVDSQINFKAKKEFLDAYNAEKGHPNPNDSNATYRTSYPEEYLAIAVDEYYCNDQTKKQLKEMYPLAYDLVDKHFISLLAASGKGTEPPQTTPTPSPNPSPVPTPTPSIPTPTPTTQLPTSQPTASDETPNDDSQAGTSDSIPTPPLNHAGKKKATTSSSCD